MTSSNAKSTHLLVWMTHAPLPRKLSFEVPPLVTSPIQPRKVLGVPTCSCCRNPGDLLEVRQSVPSVTSLHSHGLISLAASHRQGTAFSRVSQLHACNLWRMTWELPTFHLSGLDGCLYHLEKRRSSHFQEHRPVE